MCSKAFNALFSASLVLQTLGYLTLTPNFFSSETKLTCESNDDDAALVWNRYLTTDSNYNDPNFDPKRWRPKSSSKCAVWRSTRCLSKWKNRTVWDIVNSADKPMGPVFDYRWEDFYEFVFKDKGGNMGYGYVKEVKQHSSHLVFSVRTNRGINIFICKEKDRSLGPCLWVTVGGRKRDYSTIRLCENGLPADERWPEHNHCGSLESITHKNGNIVDKHEWRTFRISWNGTENTLQVFDTTESIPFMETSLDSRWKWPDVSHIHLGSGMEARVRFHFYEYMTTNHRNAFLSTKEFNTDKTSLTFKLLIGLCHRCGMHFDLVHNESIIQTETKFGGNDTSVSSGLLNWRSVEVKFNLSIRQTIKLKIRNVLNGEAGGHWAVGNIRLCDSADVVRKSTIKFPKMKQSRTSTPWVKCQKLFYEENAILEYPGNIGFVGDEKLQVDTVGDLISLKIPAVEIANRYHMIEGVSVKVVIKGLLTCAYFNADDSSSLRNSAELTIAEYVTNEKTPRSFLIGVNQTNREDLNCSLNFGKEYVIEVNLKYGDSGFRGSASITLEGTQFETLAVALVAIFSILAIILIVLFVWWRCEKSKSQRSNNAVVSLSEVAPSTENLVPLTISNRRRSVLAAIKKRVSSHIYASVYETDSRSVSIEHFEKYAKESSDNGVLISQFLVFPRGLTRPYTYGKLAENLPKNRDSNVIPYDDTRVVLQKVSGDPYSDYINASYIPGYRNERAYIATQTPLENTINDFWKMVWHEKVHVICMLTNSTDSSKMKREQYWPEIGAKEKYDTVKVMNLGHEVFADYIITTLRISCQKWKRRVTHLQYTRWPHHGVPRHFQSLVTYLNKMDKSMTGNGPVVVHCKTGSGRTGTIILCDVCLRQAAAERAIDVLAHATRLRHNRADMIDNQQQYLLAHIVIAETIAALPTQIPCTDDLRRMVKKLMRRLPEHIERLNESMWQERALFSLVPPHCPTPGDFTRQRLPELNSAYPEVVFFERTSITNRAKKTFVSVVSVDGVRVKKQYLASQTPTISTRSKFWRLVAEKNVELVVILQNPDPGDPSCCGLMPRRTNVISVPFVQVEITRRIHDKEHFTMDTVQLIDTSEGEERLQPVTVLTLTGWGHGKHGAPPTPEVLVDVWRTSENIARKKGPTLVLCHDGITGCGLYLAMSFLLERMAVERECDVISAVRAVRRFRPEFVQGLDQFQYLYDTAVNYVECFETYSNFI